jgi:hypothetical protein
MQLAAQRSLVAVGVRHDLCTFVVLRFAVGID